MVAKQDSIWTAFNSDVKVENILLGDSAVLTFITLNLLSRLFGARPSLIKLMDLNVTISAFRDWPDA